MKKVVNRRDYQDTLDKAEKNPNAVIVVEFTAPWCTSCKKLAPELSEYVSANPEIHFIEYDLGLEMNHEDEMDVKAQPTFKIFRGGRLISAFAGANMKKLNECIETAQSISPK